MTRFALLLSSLSLVAACTDDADDDHDDAHDAPDAAADPEPDAEPDDGCDEPSVLPAQWRPIDRVSTGTVTTTSASGVTTAVIDATAGGTMMAADNPYVYVDLVAGAKVEISDVDSLDDDRWHVAFKRAGIKANGGDSGTGGVTIAVVAGDSMEAVTAAPADGEFGADDWADAACEFVGLAGGEPATRMGEWYDYDPSAHALTPQAEVYVVRIPGEGDVRVEIETYYGDGANPMRGAIYRVRWAAL